MAKNVGIIKSLLEEGAFEPILNEETEAMWIEVERVFWGQNKDTKEVGISFRVWGTKRRLVQLWDNKQEEFPLGALESDRQGSVYQLFDFGNYLKAKD